MSKSNNTYRHVDAAYRQLCLDVLRDGERKENRTGVDTLSTFGLHYNLDLEAGFPLLTSKSIAWKNIVVEMLWFLSGQTDISILKRHGCKFWDAWVDEEGRVPSAYGNFWRHFPVPAGYRSGAGGWSGSPGVEGVAANDQMAWVLAEMVKNPMSRRMIVSAWAPGNAQTSKLPPCHAMFIFNVQNETFEPEVVHGGTDCARGWASWCGLTGRTLDRDENFDPTTMRLCTRCRTYSPVWNAADDHAKALHETISKTRRRLCLHLTQRSCDVALGVPYNIASYALLMHIASRISGIEVGTFSHTLVDAHLYTRKPDGSMGEFDHLHEQIARAPRPMPKLVIDPSIRTLADIEALMAPEVTTEHILEMFKLEGYDPHPAIHFKVAV